MYADENVIKIKHDVLYTVAKLAFEGRLEEERDHIATERLRVQKLRTQKKSGGKDHPWSNRSFDLSSAWCCSVCSFGAYYYWSISSGSVTALYCKRCDFSGWCLSGCHCCP